jgi:hypothetical protein
MVSWVRGGRIGRYKPRLREALQHNSFSSDSVTSKNKSLQIRTLAAPG